MAGTVTHFYFANDVMSSISKKKKIVYDEDLLKIFAQSMDTFNFYSIFFPIKNKSSEIRKFANKFHCNKTDVFFETLINYIKGKNLSTNIYVMTFLYGLITHYILDSSMHPYVEYKCGRFNSKDKKTYKYNAKHHEMETFIDIYMLEKHEINAKYFKAYKELFKINSFDIELQDVMNYTFKKVFNFENFDKYYLKSIKDMKYSFQIFRYDPYGCKKAFYRLFDLFSTKKILNSKFLSYNYIPKNAFNYLNLEHKTWYYPFDIAKKYDCSFDELYNDAVKRCVNVIIKVENYIEKNKELDLKSLFNLSYCTGLDLKILEKSPSYEF